MRTREAGCGGSRRRTGPSTLRTQRKGKWYYLCRIRLAAPTIDGSPNRLTHGMPVVGRAVTACVPEPQAGIERTCAIRLFR
ncbi:hypothetical protein GCM10009716_18310 [Streptomyces sodiiphilus]|uniref:Integrase n=1 Tax=Streptomyces sodiiphilus TaxID=226217 RepID=A0ABN2P024_9ACTN